METSIRANVRQFAALWYSADLQRSANQDAAREHALMQIQLYLSDYGIGQEHARPYLEAASEAIDQIFQPQSKSN